MIDEKQLKEYLKKDIENSFIFLGEQSFFINRYSNLILQKFKNNSLYEFVEISFDEVDFNFILDTISFVGFLVTKKFIHIKGVDILKMSSGDILELSKILNENTDNIILVTTIECSDNSKIKAFVKNINDSFIIANFSTQKGDNIKLVEDRCKKHNVTIKKYAIEHLINMTSKNMDILMNEVDKLCLYKINEEITIDDINILTSKTVEQSVFLLIDFIIKKQLKMAMNLYKFLIDNKEAPISILSALSIGFIDLYRYKLNIQYGGEIEFLIKGYGYKKNDFRLKKASWNYKKLTQKQMDLIIENIFITEKRLKTKNINGEIELQILIIGLIKICWGNI